MPILNPQYYQKKFTVDDIECLIVTGELRCTVVNGYIRIGTGSNLLIKLKENEECDD